MAVNDDSDAVALGAALIGALFLFLGYPMLAEGTTNSCLALERHVAGSVANLDNGRGAAATASKQFPGMPTLLSCSYIYWRVVTD